MSRVFKSSRIVLDDKAFVLTHRPSVHESLKVNDMLQSEVEPSDWREILIDNAKLEANQILEDADSEARNIVQSAEKSSESIVSDAYDQARGIMEQAQEQGYKDGFENSLQEARNEAKMIIDQAQDIKDQWIKERSELFTRIEKDMVALVLETTEKILNHHVEDDLTLIESIIRLGIQRVTRTDLLTIRVSNEDYNHAVSVKPLILSISDRVQEIEIKRDVALRNGSCVIDTDSGSIDCGIWTQFEQVKSLFEQMLRGE